MKVKTVLISWHGREPVYSIDFHSSGRVATGGADNCVNVRHRGDSACEIDRKSHVFVI